MTNSGFLSTIRITASIRPSPSYSRHQTAPAYTSIVTRDLLQILKDEGAKKGGADSGWKSS